MAPSVFTPTKPEVPARTGDFGGNGNGSGGRGFGGGGGWDGGTWAIPSRTYRTGMWIGLAAIAMLFAAFTSAMVVRKGISTDWVRTEFPRILWVNTVVLLASSVTLEFSRRSLAAGRVDSFSRWLYATLILGLGFVAGQLVAWRQLASRGVYLSTNPSSSFFYLLTAAHGVHLLGGITALSYIVLKAGRIGFAPRQRAVVGVAAMYWHFMDGLWIYLLILLTVRS